MNLAKTWWQSSVRALLEPPHHGGRLISLCAWEVSSCQVSPPTAYGTVGKGRSFGVGLGDTLALGDARAAEWRARCGCSSHMFHLE